MNMIELGNTIAFHPGYYVKDYIYDKEDSFTEFANKLDVSLVELFMFMDGYTDVDDELAEKLSNVIGTSKEYWINLQDNYNKFVDKFGDEYYEI